MFNDKKYPNVGSNVKGIITGKKDYGYFISFDDGHESGLLHSAEIDDKVKTKDYNIGDEIELKVLAINYKDNRINFGTDNKSVYLENMYDQPSLYVSKKFQKKYTSNKVHIGFKSIEKNLKRWLKDQKY